MHSSDQFSTASFNRVSSVKTDPRICNQFERSYDANVRSGAAFEGALTCSQSFLPDTVASRSQGLQITLARGGDDHLLGTCLNVSSGLGISQNLILIKLSSLTKQFANQPCAISTQSDLLLHIDIQVLHLLRLDEKPSGLNHILHSHFLEGSNQ